MNPVWLFVEDFNAATWKMWLVPTENEATIMNGANAQQADHAVRGKYPNYDWEKTQISDDAFILHGLLKSK